MVEKNLFLLPSQYQESINLRAIYDNIMAKIYEKTLEIKETNQELSLDFAKGLNLDKIGEDLLTPRQSLNDSEYRNKLKKQASSFSPDGHMSLINSILKRYTNKYKFIEGLAKFEIIILDQTIPSDIIKEIENSIRNEKPAGIGMNFSVVGFIKTEEGGFIKTEEGYNLKVE